MENFSDKIYMISLACYITGSSNVFTLFSMYDIERKYLLKAALQVAQFICTRII